MTIFGRVFENHEVRDPSFLRFLFENRAMAPIWLVARLYLGWQWLHAGWEKLTGDGWMNQNGAGLQGFWERQVQQPEEGRPPITYDWYRDFIQYMLDHDWYEWFAPLIAISETAVGLLLIAGAFTAVAAFFGAFLNFNFLLAGTASTNPVLFVIALLLIAAWKTAGYIGVDRWLLPALGAPWSPGSVFRRDVPARE